MECSFISFICIVIFLFLQNVPPSEAENEHDHQFHARPIPKNVFEVPNVERKPMPVTVPQTPKFSEAGKASLYNWRRQRSKVIFIFLVLRTYFNFLLRSRTAAWGRPRATRRRDRLTRQEVNEWRIRSLSHLASKRETNKCSGNENWKSKRFIDCGTCVTVLRIDTFYPADHGRWEKNARVPR